jgi:photosystem II PsbJ protein
LGTLINICFSRSIFKLFFLTKNNFSLLRQFINNNFTYELNMSDIGRVPLWMVATVGGLAALGLVTLFFFGAYFGLGSSL